MDFDIRTSKSGVRSYNGLSDPKAFTRTFKITAAMFGWTKEVKAEMLSNMLVGKAKKAFDALSGGDQADPAKILERLELDCKVSGETLLSEFRNRRPKQDESMAQFGAELEDLVTRALPNCPTSERLSLLRGQLCSILPNYLVTIINFNLNKSWDELLASLDGAVSASGGLENVMMENAGVKSEPMGINAVYTSSGRFNGSCHHCGRSGHRKRDCYQLKDKRVAESRGTGRGYERGNEGRSSGRSGEGKNRGREDERRGAHARTGEYEERGVGKATGANNMELGDDSSDEESLYLNKLEVVKASTGLELDLNTLTSRVALIKKTVRVGFRHEATSVKLKALLDGGATNSFIQISKLSGKTQRLVKEFILSNDKSSVYGFRKEVLVIKGATGAVTETCVIVEVKLKIGSWIGIHTCVLTKALVDKDVILGRDFLKAHEVVIDHGKDIITISKPDAKRVKAFEGELVGLDKACVVVDSVELKARSETVVKCAVLEAACENQEVIFVPNANADGICWGHSVNKVDANGWVHVNVINLNDKPVVIEAHRYVGFVDNRFTAVEESVAVEAKTIVAKKAKSSEVEEERERVAKLKVGSDLTSEQGRMIKELLINKIEAFQWSDTDIGRTDLIEHGIDTGEHGPVRQKQFRQPQALQEEMDKQLDEMMKTGLIEESSSPWCSPVMIIKQLTRDGRVKFRFLADMRAVNELTKKDAFPLPSMDQALDALGGAVFFSVMDMARGYFQVPLKDEDKEKTAFRANNRLYQWTVMPLGLANAPSTFSRLMDMVLNGLTFVYCLVYLDDTIVYSRTFEEHMKHVEEVLERIIKAKLKLKPEKCVFAAGEVNYLGFVVTRSGIKPDKDKVKAISELEFPRSPRAMIRFLGAVNFYRDFIKSFSGVASVLYKMSQSVAKFKAKFKDPVAGQAFERLKQALMSEPVLVYPDFKQQFIIQTDASSVALGAVIGQVNSRNNSKFQPVMFASRHLTDAETRYSTSERELLAIVFAAKRFNVYVYGRHVTFVTDHQPLVSMKNLKDPMGRIGRLLNKIQDLDYSLVYQPGATNYVADFLSRPDNPKSSLERPIEGETELNATELEIVGCVNWIAEQARDVAIKGVLELMKERLASELEVESVWSGLKLAEWFKIRSKLVVSGGVLMVNANEEQLGQRIVVPVALVPTILNLLHDGPLAGHRDFEKTLEMLRRRYFWLRLRLDVLEYCESCHLCQTKKHLGKLPKAPLKQIKVDTPWSVLGLDVAGPLKRTANGNLYMIVVVDYFTKFCVAKAVPDNTAKTAAKFLFDEVVCKFGLPKTIISDNGVNFKADLFKRVCKLCGITNAYASVYHPMANGQVERTIKSTKQILTMYVNTSHSDWDDYLQASICAYNSSTHASIKFSPYEVLFGRKPLAVSEVILGQPEEISKKKEVNTYVRDLKSNIKRIHDAVNVNLDKARARQKIQHDKFVNNANKYKVGDKVLVQNERKLIGESKSFRPKASGPYEIIKIFNDVDFRLRGADGKVQVAHYNRVLPYLARDDRFQQRCRPVLRINSDAARQSKIASDLGRVGEVEELVSDVTVYLSLLVKSLKGAVVEEDLEGDGSESDDNEGDDNEGDDNAGDDLDSRGEELGVVIGAPDSVEGVEAELNLEVEWVNCDECNKVCKGTRGLNIHKAVHRKSIGGQTSGGGVVPETVVEEGIDVNAPGLGEV